jgi:hypothetical protein
MKNFWRSVVLFTFVLLLCACNAGPAATSTAATPTAAAPTAEILADSFFFGCAYLDENGNGEIDPDDPGLKDALFAFSTQVGIGLSGYTSSNGCATIVVPGGLGAEAWPVTAHMQPPAESNLELVDSAEVVLAYPESHADFLFTESP